MTQEHLRKYAELVTKLLLDNPQDDAILQEAMKYAHKYREIETGFREAKKSGAPFTTQPKGRVTQAGGWQ